MYFELLILEILVWHWRAISSDPYKILSWNFKDYQSYPIYCINLPNSYQILRWVMSKPQIFCTFWCGMTKSIQLMSMERLWAKWYFLTMKNNNVCKLIEVVHKIAPLKTVRIKNTSSKSFAKEIAETFSLRDKIFKNFKSRLLNINWEI